MTREKELNATPAKKPPEGFGEILKRAESGDKSVLPQVREMLRSFPDMAREVGNLTTLACKELRRRFVGDSLVIGQALRHQEEAVLEQVAGPNPTALEKLLADQIVLCWQHVRYLEIKYAQTKSYSFREGEYHERCIDKAQKRYLQAIKTMAQIRKLGVPALQVNIATEGGRQVNISESRPSP